MTAGDRPASVALARSAPIAGWGVAGVSYNATDVSAQVLAAQAVGQATEHAGLSVDDIDGLIVTRSPKATSDDLGTSLQVLMGLSDLKYCAAIEAKGASAVHALLEAQKAVAIGGLESVVCVFADVPVPAERNTGQSFGHPFRLSGFPGSEAACGAYGGATAFALYARRILEIFGWGEQQTREIVLSTRRWAALNPDALQSAELHAVDYDSSPWIVEPLRLLDCSRPSNGGAAVVVTSPERAKASGRNPAYILGGSLRHTPICDRPEGAWRDGEGRGWSDSIREALDVAGISPSQLSTIQAYDAFSFLPLLALASAGICDPAEVAGLLADEATRPGGSLPLNTGGGQLSGSYLQGMTPLLEAIVQAQHEGGARQVPNHEHSLVVSQGGVGEHFGVAVVSSERPS